jgi:hypothetical protein
MVINALIYKKHANVNSKDPPSINGQSSWREFTEKYPILCEKHKSGVEIKIKIIHSFLPNVLAESFLIIISKTQNDYRSLLIDF